MVIVVVLMVALPRQHGYSVRIVDLGSTIDRARAAAPYHVLVPQNLPAAWRPTHGSVNISGSPPVVEVHFDYVSPDDGYVGVVQANTQSWKFVTDATAGNREIGLADIDGTVWVRMQSTRKPDQLSLVLYRGQTTTVVSGVDGWDRLEQLAGSLS